MKTILQAIRKYISSEAFQKEHLFEPFTQERKKTMIEQCNQWLITQGGAGLTHKVEDLHLEDGGSLRFDVVKRTSHLVNF